jgi:hypothetical protein
MGVRKIKISNSALTGSYSSKKKLLSSDFESSLERDFICLLEFDVNVDTYEEQPLEIIYSNGKLRSYTPDFLVRYRKDISPAKWLKDTIFEIKYLEELEKRRNELKPKFDAAEEYASRNELVFKVITETEIRTDYLFNAKFLSGYRNGDFNFNNYEHISRVLRDLRATTPYELLLVVTSDQMKRAEYLHTMWYMISVSLIGCDLTKKLSMNTEIWYSSPTPLKNIEPCRH